MRPAPALAVHCAPSRAWRIACAALGAAAAAALSAWACGHLESSAGVTGLAAAAASALGAAFGLRVAGPRVATELRWDGARWHVGGVAGEVQLMLDFGRWLLLMRQRVVPASGRRRVRWIAASFARGAPQAGELRALRTALYSPRPEPTLPHVRAPDRAPD
jgi:hypothetical protein